MCKEGRRPARLSKDILVILECKKAMYRQLNQEHVSWEECRKTDQMCRDEIRKAKTQLELSLIRDALGLVVRYERMLTCKTANLGFRSFFNWPIYGITRTWGTNLLLYQIKIRFVTTSGA